MKKPLKIPSIVLFLMPIVVAIAIFSFLNFSCQSRSEDAAGTFKLLYTSEVGGRLDPCG